MPTPITDPIKLKEIAERNAALDFGSVSSQNGQTTYKSDKQTFSYPGASDTTKDSTAVEPTIGDVIGYIPKNDTTYDEAVQAYKDSLQTKEMTEEEIRQKTQERMQAQIDSLDRYYAEQIARENVAGQGRLGESSAIQARRGLIGSDFGQDQTATTRDYNTGVVNAINAEKQAKIASILSEGRNSVVKEAADKLAAKKAGAQEYLTFLAGEQDRKTARVSATVSNLINGGVEPTDEDLKTLATQLGVSVQELKAQYNAGKKSLATPKKLTEVSPGASLYDENGKLIGTAPTTPADASKPITQEVGGTLLQWNPTTKAWDSIYTAPAKVTDQKIVKIDGVDYVQNADGSYTRPTVPTGTTTEKAEKAGNIVNKINSLLATDDWKAGVGPVSASLPDWASGKRNTAMANIEEIISSLALENLNLLKGPMSDKDIMFIKDASAGLRTSMDEASFKKKIEAIRDRMVEVQNKAKTESTSTKMIGPDGLTYNVPNDQVEAFIQDGGKRFNNVGGDTNKATEKTINKAVQVSDNTSGGQCGAFVRKVAGVQMGDKYEQKLAKMDPSIKTPQPGMVFVMPYSWTGHTGVILDVKDGIATVKHSNFNLDEKVTTDKIPVSRMTGFAYPKLS